MPQFLIPHGKKPDDRVTLSPEESHHAVKVLRLERGSHVRLSDGAGGLFTGRIETITPKQAVVWIEAAVPTPKNKACVILAQGLLKGDKMEFVLQKAAELGAAAVQPFTSSRTVADWKGDKKLERLRKIAEAASKQCGRATHLEIREPVDFSSVVATQADAKAIFWEEADGSSPLHSRRGSWPAGPEDRILITIGPEGGFSRDEIDAAKAKGFDVLSLGSLILRAETAALTSLSVLQYELGNL